MKNYLQFTEGEITIYCGENARNTVNASLKMASAISKSKRRGNILYINTVFTKRKLFAAARQVFPSPGTPGEGLGVRAGVTFYNIPVGELCNSFNTISDLIEAQNIKHVIINAWEFANRCYGYKERSIFELKGLLAEFGVSILIYSQSRLAEPGKIQRNGLGKLAALADDIILLQEEDESDAVSDTRTPVPEPRIEMLVSSKINELDYAREEIHPLSGGELILEEEELMEMQN